MPDKISFALYQDVYQNVHRSPHSLNRDLIASSCIRAGSFLRKARIIALLQFDDDVHMKHLERVWNSIGANPVVETPDVAAVPIMPEGTPTPPTPPVATAFVPGSSFTFTTATIRYTVCFQTILDTKKWGNFSVIKKSWILGGDDNKTSPPPSFP